MSRDRPAIGGGILCAAYAMGMAAMASARGIGVTPDSTVYLAAARHLRDGAGLLTPAWDGQLVPLTHYPPLFPLVLAGLGRHANVLAAVRVLHVVAFGVSVLLVGAAVARFRRPVPLASVLAAALAATSLDLLTIHTMVWSEPLFLVTGLLSLACVGAHLRTGKWGWLVAGGLLAGTASLVRFIGVALTGGGALAIVSGTERPWPERWMRALLFGVVGAAPIVAQFAINNAATGHAANRPLSLHLLLFWRARAAVLALAGWMIPGASCCLPPIAVALAGGMLLCVVAATVAWIVWRAGLASACADISTRLTVCFIAVYAGITALDMLFLDASQYFGDRILAPVFLATIVLVFAQVTRLTPGGRPRAILGVAAMLVMAFGFVAQTAYVRQARAHGLGYDTDAWRASGGVAVARAVPSDRRVVSNRPDVIRYLADRPAAGAPLKRGIQSWQPNAAFAQDMVALADEVRNGTAVVVWFAADASADALMPSPRELEERLGAGVPVGDAVVFGRTAAR